MTEHVKVSIDVSAAAVAWGSFLSYLPDVAAALSIVWTVLRLWEWYRKRRQR
jgi:hypothetical protein